MFIIFCNKYVTIYYGCQVGENFPGPDFHRGEILKVLRECTEKDVKALLFTVDFRDKMGKCQISFMFLFYGATDWPINY
jgi:hypothetical protein